MENKTWKSTTAGILSILGGASAITGGIMLTLMAQGVMLFGVVPWTAFIPELEYIPEIHGIFSGIGIFIFALGIPLIILGAVAIVGGVYALKRKKWGLALAGASCALLCNTLVGILAVVFVIMGKEEFDQDSNTIAENIVAQ